MPLDAAERPLFRSAHVANSARPARPAYPRSAVRSNCPSAISKVHNAERAGPGMRERVCVCILYGRRPRSAE